MGLKEELQSITQDELSSGVVGFLGKVVENQSDASAMEQYPAFQEFVSLVIAANYGETEVREISPDTFVAIAVCVTTALGGLIEVAELRDIQQRLPNPASE